MANQQTQQPPAPNSGNTTIVPAGTNWATALFTLLHAPATPANYQFVNQWTIREHGNLSMFANNPFFTTAGGSGTVGPIKAHSYPLIPDSAFGPGRTNSAGVPSYPSLAVGVWITAYHMITEYPAIVSALKSGNPASAAQNPAFQQQLKTWSGGGYDGFATISAPAGPAGPSIGGGGIKGASGAGGGGGGILGTIGEGLAQAVGGPVGGVVADLNPGGLISHVPGVAQGEAVAGFVGKLTDPSYILRALQILAGAGLVAVGVTLLAKQVALAADIPAPIQAVPGAAAAAAVA